VENELTTVNSPKLFEMAFASITNLPDSAASLATIVASPRRCDGRDGVAAWLNSPSRRMLPPPRRHAVSQPMFLAHDLAGKLVLVALFFLQDRVAPFLEMGKTLVEPPCAAAIQPDGGARNALQKAAIVRDQHNGRR
jgi:hypothetical protein